MSDEQIIHDQPMPTGAGEAVEPRLVALIRERPVLGRERYGTALRTHNGRDATVDALQESLDLNQYLMQRVMELEDAVAGRLPAMTVMHGMEIRNPTDGLALLAWCDRVITDAGYTIVGWAPDRVCVVSSASADDGGALSATGSLSAPDCSPRPPGRPAPAVGGSPQDAATREPLGSARELSAMEADAEAAAEVAAAHGDHGDVLGDGPTGQVCASCGSADMRPSGTCSVCANCGTSGGCS